MKKEVILSLIFTIILLATPLILAETLKVKLQVNGLDPINQTESYEGYEFNVTVFTDYLITPLELTKYPIIQDYSPGFGEFSAKLTTSSGRELSRSNFQPSFYILSNPPTETDTETVTLNFEYKEQAEFLEVYHNNNQKLKINIKELLCNKNSVCEENENYLSCQKDCPLYSEDGLCSGYSGDNYCDTDCYNDSDCDQENCNDNIQNQDETAVDQGGVCAEEDCTLKELNGDLVCGDGICSLCEDIFSCERDCLDNGETCSKPFFKIGTFCKSKQERINDWKTKRIQLITIMQDIRYSILPSL